MESQSLLQILAHALSANAVAWSLACLLGGVFGGLALYVPDLLHWFVQLGRCRIVRADLRRSGSATLTDRLLEPTFLRRGHAGAVTRGTTPAQEPPHNAVVNFEAHRARVRQLELAALMQSRSWGEKGRIQ